MDESQEDEPDPYTRNNGALTCTDTLEKRVKTTHKSQERQRFAAMLQPCPFEEKPSNYVFKILHNKIHK